MSTLVESPLGWLEKTFAQLVAWPGKKNFKEYSSRRHSHHYFVMRYMKSCVGLNFKIHSHSLPLFLSVLWWNINQFVAGGVAPFRFPVSILTVWFFFWPSRNSICATCLPIPQPPCNRSRVCQVRFLLLLYIYIYTTVYVVAWLYGYIDFLLFPFLWE